MDWSQLGFQGLSQVVNSHPIFVHFPIALLPTTLLFYTVGILKKKEKFLFAASILLSLTLFSTIATVTTGLLAEESFPHNETIHRMMMTHEKIGFTVLASVFFLFIWSWLRKENTPKFSRLFLFLLFCITLMALQNGDLGSRMVFVEGAAVKVVPSDSHHGDENHHNHHHEEGNHEHQ